MLNPRPLDNIMPRAPSSGLLLALHPIEKFGSSAITDDMAAARGSLRGVVGVWKAAQS
jgi:hypothetical protein